MFIIVFIMFIIVAPIIYIVFMKIGYDVMSSVRTGWYLFTSEPIKCATRIKVHPLYHYIFISVHQQSFTPSGNNATLRSR